MKDFYIGERYDDKRKCVLETIKPICEVFGIENYDYTYDTRIDNDGTEMHSREILWVEGTRIGCSSNSIGATVMELINYIWINTVAKNKYFPFQKQCLNALKRYWYGEGE